MHPPPRKPVFYFSSKNPTGATTIVQLPLAFVRSEYVSVASNYINAIGSGLQYWSFTSYSSEQAYYTYMGGTYIQSSGLSSRWTGFPLRCRTTKNEGGVLHISNAGPALYTSYHIILLPKFNQFFTFHNNQNTPDACRLTKFMLDLTETL